MIKNLTALLNKNSIEHAMYFCEWCWDFRDADPAKVAEHTLNNCDYFKNKKRKRLELKK